MTKPDLYATIIADLSGCWKEDETLMETDPTVWHLAREIDDFLYQYRDDPRVSVEQYARNVQRLIEIYLSAADEREAV